MMNAFLCILNEFPHESIEEISLSELSYAQIW